MSQNRVKYETIIFDCDGVILDSNEIKVEAMGNALVESGVDAYEVEKCTTYFKNNFGKSRFHHVEAFKKIISNKEFSSNQVLLRYTKYCDTYYYNAKVIPGVIALLDKLPMKPYIASGSEQEQLRKVLNKKGLTQSFEKIYGSPMPKIDVVEKILQINSKNAVFIGDSIADYEAAKANNIDFIFYSPYSLCREKMLILSNSAGFAHVESMEELYDRL